MNAIIPYLIFMGVFLMIILVIYNISNRRTTTCDIFDKYKQEVDNTGSKWNPIIMHKGFHHSPNLSMLS